MQVTVRNGNVEKALKILKKKMFDEGSIKRLMERRYYEKPSAKRRRCKLDAINRQKKTRERELTKNKSMQQKSRRKTK